MRLSCPSLPELSSVKVSLLVENTARGSGILGEHGLSWHIESEGHSLLFDLGQGFTMEKNAGRMGVDWAASEAVVFSHGHYDHVGGWRTWSKALGHARVYLHPSALELKYQARPDRHMLSAGDRHFAAALRGSSAELHMSTEPLEVLPGIWMTGEVPRETNFEDTGGDFYSGRGASRRDMLPDDQSLFFKTPAGLVVIVGCAHAGLINILRYCRRLTGQRIHAVAGGLHLLNASENRMRQTIEALEELAPDWLAPNHCTGDAAVARLYAAFPGRVLEMHAGQSFDFPLQGHGGKD